jgi:hypothetical protein
MLKITRSCHLARLLSVCLLLLMLVLACESRDRYIGTYRAEADKLPKQAEMIMELKANGDGAWKMGDEEIPFTWYVKSGELRINTKGGGVIVGSTAANAIQIILPGIGPLRFKKIH